MARWQQYVLFAVWLILLASTPLWATNYVVRLAITIAMFTALTLSWNFIGGFAGYPSFSTAAFFGLGCYAGALAQRAGMPMVLAWAIATLFVGAFAAALGAHHPAAPRPLLRHRLDRRGRGGATRRLVMGQPDRRR